MMKSYLINLDKDSERLAFFKKNFDRLNLSFERISAIDGRLFSEQEYQNFIKVRPRNNTEWLRGQMGCFLSHFEAWKRIAEGNEKFCAVFEDDIHISDDLNSILMDSDWIPETADIIRLETSTNRIKLTSSPVLTCSQRGVYGVKSTSWCAGAYILNQKTAQKLIALPEAAHDASDVILYHFDLSAIVPELNILQFNPAPCTQDKYLVEGNVKFASNIESMPSVLSQFKEKIIRITPLSIVRAVYRSLAGYKRVQYR